MRKCTAPQMYNYHMTSNPCMCVNSPSNVGAEDGAKQTAPDATLGQQHRAGITNSVQNGAPRVDHVCCTHEKIQ